ncbi:hypothetical protein [Streptomyces sp. NPDC086777]|uniref:tetratricopeptide repeat protein n=1 Tax=Streptomyces sp. NPDC086777 TaxID=3154866 RepID=UPI00345008F9
MDDGRRDDRRRRKPFQAGSGAGLTGPGTVPAPNPPPAVLVQSTNGGAAAYVIEQLHQHFPGRQTVVPLDRARPVESWTAQQLGVHPAIPGGPGTAAEFVLPGYIRRDHDRQLRRRLTAAATSGETALVVVRGASCTGKTRSAYEATRACLGDWQLVFPKGADGLSALLAADALGPRTVLWLNEAQDFLTGQAGEAAAAALRRRMEEPGPLVVLATLWPSYYRDLTATPEAPGEDAHPHARALLDPVVPITVPEAFDGQALRELATRADLSLATAARTTPAGTITQTLAAGPDLVDHYEQPVPPHGPYGRAIIAAAMDARRLGHTSPLPAAFLEAAAPGYLTEQLRAAAEPGTWFTHALAYAKYKVKGVAAALEPVADPSGMGSLPATYRLADYLDHHARTTRRCTFPPASFWIAARHHAATPADLSGLADAAHVRARFRTAVALYQQAAAGGDTEAMCNLGYERQKTGDLVGALELFRQAAERGDDHGLAAAADLLRRTGEHKAVARMYLLASARGSAFAPLFFAEERERAGDPKGAEGFYRQAVANGSTSALLDLGELRERAGDLQEAGQLYRQAAARGAVSALLHLAGKRERAGDLAGAERLCRQARDAGSSEALTLLVGLRERAGDRPAVMQMVRDVFDAGGARALTPLARGLEQIGHRDMARWLYEKAAAEGETYALTWVAERRATSGDPQGAEPFYRQAAAQGDPRALVALASQRKRAGDLEEAEQLYRQAAARGDNFALVDLAEERKLAGDLEGVRRLYPEVAVGGDIGAVDRLAELLEQAGDREGVTQLYRQALDAGERGALDRLAKLREQVGDIEGAERLRQFGLGPDGAPPEAST